MKIDKRSRSVGYWEGVIVVAVLWMTSNIVDVPWWAMILIAAAIGAVLGTVFAFAETAIEARGRS